MTPKDKAVDLIDKMRVICLIIDDYVYKSTVKQCALTVVDELIELSMYTDGYYGWVDYWEEVKIEIEKL